jgi:hypothetical protein
MLQRVLTFLGRYVAVSAVAALLLLLYLFPDHPNSLRGWLILFVVALPIILVGELIAKFFYKNPHARAVDAKTVGRSFSWLRISFMFVTMLLLFALELVGLRWLGLLHHG